MRETGSGHSRLRLAPGEHPADIAESVVAFSALLLQGEGGLGDGPGCGQGTVLGPLEPAARIRNETGARATGVHAGQEISTGVCALLSA